MQKRTLETIKNASFYIFQLILNIVYCTSSRSESSPNLNNCNVLRRLRKPRAITPMLLKVLILILYPNDYDTPSPKKKNEKKLEA